MFACACMRLIYSHTPSAQAQGGWFLGAIAIHASIIKFPSNCVCLYVCNGPHLAQNCLSGRGQARSTFLIPLHAHCQQYAGLEPYKVDTVLELCAQRLVTYSHQEERAYQEEMQCKMGTSTYSDRADAMLPSLQFDRPIIHEDITNQEAPRLADTPVCLA